MAISLERFGIDQLSVEERLELVYAIWDSIASKPLPPLNAELCAELDRRMADHEAHPEDAIPWDEVKQDALDRLKK